MFQHYDLAVGQHCSHSYPECYTNYEHLQITSAIDRQLLIT